MSNLSDLARPASPELLGGGLARMAGNKLSLRKQYQDYVIQANESGEDVLPFSEWAESKSNG